MCAKVEKTGTSLEARFLGSYSLASDCLEDSRPEYAFIGRSNVGKSSLINMITGYSKLAKVSSSPGKTRLLNSFSLSLSGAHSPTECLLMDMPGYGYARVSKKLRAHMHTESMRYFSRRKNLCCIMVLLDIRLQPQAIDLDFLHKLGSRRLPLALVFTKTDKLSRSAVAQHLSEYHKSLLTQWKRLPDYYLSSAVLGEGKTELLAFFRQTTERYMSKKK